MENNELNVNEMNEVAGGRKQGGYDKKPVEKKGCIIYRIQHGDTLTRIANRYKTTVSAIMKANPVLTDASFIVSGLYIYIPQ